MLIIRGADPKELLKKERESLPSPKELLTLRKSDTLYGKALVKAVAEELKMPKREVYEIYLKTEKNI